jgi:hypothetical protein
MLREFQRRAAPSPAAPLRHRPLHYHAIAFAPKNCAWIAP